VNAQQNAEIQTQESQRTTTGKQVLTEPAGPSNSRTEPYTSDLAGIQVTMMLEQLLRLVPRFREGIRRTSEGTVTTTAPAVQLTEVDERVIDFGSKVESKFQIGDRVWLLQCNVKTTRHCDKLDYQCLGPFMISTKSMKLLFGYNYL
jgi:hypothetical protein